MASTTFDDLITSSLPSPIYHTFFPPMDDDETTLPSEDVFTTMLPGNITHPPLYEESTAQMESTSTIYNIIGGHYIEDHTSSGIILIGHPNNRGQRGAGHLFTGSPAEAAAFG
ncbi:uncharacterized protein LOC125288162 isoform X2 [Alosa alosa]|uniref:uncharacterized protein LOC125288162 isoform X2 n=1 Tax=Alosa alosa TaxID=278164 RepID=UPI0020152026|nr:uncharacterized protein LOC125288162 isoform X2 [Alosa alosa]